MGEQRFLMNIDAWAFIVEQKWSETIVSYEKLFFSLNVHSNAG